MLVLTRSIGESILIMDGGTVLAEVMLIQAREGKARIGLQSDSRYKILRSELHVQESSDA